MRTPPPPKRPYDSLFTPRPSSPPQTPGAPYGSLFTPGHTPSPPSPRPSSDAPPIAKTALGRAYYAFKYAGQPRLPPIASRIASLIPITFLLFKSFENAMNQTMYHTCPAFVVDKNGRLQWAGPAQLWGTVGLAYEADGRIALERIKWALVGANVVLNSEATRTRNPHGFVSNAQTWLNSVAGRFLPGPVAAGVTPLARRPWDKDETSEQSSFE